MVGPHVQGQFHRKDNGLELRGQANHILFRGDQKPRPALSHDRKQSAKVIDSVYMMVGKTEASGEPHPQAAKRAKKTLGSIDSGKRHSRFALDRRQGDRGAVHSQTKTGRQMTACKYRLVRKRDLYFRLHRCRSVGRGFSACKNDHIGSLQMVYRLAQWAEWKEQPVAERIGGVEENDVHVAGQTKVLETVIKDEKIGAAVSNCEVS